LARSRYQTGSLSLRGSKKKVWVGRWREDELLPDGTRRRIHRREVIGTLQQFPTKRLAQRKLDQRISHINSLDYHPDVAITFEQFVDKWKVSALPQYKQATRAHLISDINHHLLPVFGDVLLREIRTEQVQAFIASLRVGPKTVHNVLAAMRTVWRTANAWGYVTHDPFEGVMLPEIAKAEPRCFAVEEALRIIANAKEPYRTLYWLAAESGMRAGELCGLRWQDVDFDHFAVRVRQSSWNGHMQTPKSAAGRRTFAISAELAEHLRTTKGDRDGLVFLNKLGRPLRGGKVVEKHLGPLLKKLGIPHRGLHAFRHMNGSLMDQFSVPIKVRQERLGHSTAMITLDRYTHAIGEDDRRIARELGRILCPVVPNSSAQGSSPEATGVVIQ
jgi:integrase